MTELDVDGIRFTFDDQWSAVKWDDTATYRLGIAALQGPGHGTKAVDMIGLHDGIPYLFEVKDFRGSAIAIANLHRDLPLEIAFKSRDTAAGVVGAVARGMKGAPAEWLAAVACKPSAIKLVAWIAEDAARPGETDSKRKARRRGQHRPAACLAHRASARAGRRPAARDVGAGCDRAESRRCRLRATAILMLTDQVLAIESHGWPAPARRSSEAMGHGAASSR